MGKFIDLIGQKFGRLIVIQRAGNDKWGNSRWLCKCDCKGGKEIIISGFNLRGGHTKSCGCLKKEKATKHGHYNDEIYRSWHGMIQRCINPNNRAYYNYGGRGITVCKEWLYSFLNFKRDNPGWKSGLTLERTDNEKGYYKENCKWVTPKEQARNRRDNLYVEYNGEKRLLVELCEEHNMPYGLVYERIYRYNWSIEKALTTSTRKKRKNAATR